MIKKLDLDSIESYLKSIVEMSSQVRLMQEQLEDAISHTESNEMHFKVLGISKIIYKKNKDKFRKEVNFLSSEIDRSIKKLLNDAKNLEDKLEESRV